MLRLEPTTQNYAWGSAAAIPQLLGRPAGEAPVAEAWFGAHGSAPSMVGEDEPKPLDSVIASDPERLLGETVVRRFGPGLPYLLKLIAAERPLSLQVHPHVRSAVEGFAREEAAGVARTSPLRSYRDRNHKPELVYALTQFEAMCGFRAPRRAAELFAGLEGSLAQTLHGFLADEPSAAGIEKAFTFLLDPSTRPTAKDVAEVALACAERLVTGSPSPRSDRTVVLLQDEYPGDPGVVVSLLLNPVTLQPGEAVFVPAGGVHAYLKGVGVEIMASSDNVLRAGLTPKHVDVTELLRNVDYVAAPPIRIAPEMFHSSTRMFYAPVDDFELSVTRVQDDEAHPLPGGGPRILLCLEGAMSVTTRRGGSLDLGAGDAVFVSAQEGAARVQGRGVLVQADVP